MKKNRDGWRCVEDTSQWVFVAVVPEESCYDDLKAIVLELLTLRNNWRAHGLDLSQSTFIAAKMPVFVKVEPVKAFSKYVPHLPERWTLADLIRRMPGQWGTPGVIIGRPLGNVGIEIDP